MFALLDRFASRPEPFSEYTAVEFWNHPHVSRQMLAHHLDPANDLASRRPEAVEATVSWLDRHLTLAGKRICDLGCGPGLYTRRFHDLGAHVTGIDVSEVSLAYARAEADRHGLEIDYHQGDYTLGALPDELDLCTLIFCDYCVLSPGQRRALLRAVHSALETGGRFALDVHSMAEFEMFAETDVVEHRLMNGFWAPHDYVGLKKSIKYEREHVSLDRYLIIEAAEHREIFNWLQYFSRESLEAELIAAGFELEEVAGSLQGEPLDEDSRLMGIIARAI